MLLVVNSEVSGLVQLGSLTLFDDGANDAAVPLYDQLVGAGGQIDHGCLCKRTWRGVFRKIVQGDGVALTRRNTLFGVLSCRALAIRGHLSNVQHFHAGVFEVKGGFYGVALVDINMQALMAQGPTLRPQI